MTSGAMTTGAAPTERAAALDRLKQIVGERGWIAEPAAMAPYLAETRGLFHGETELVVRPDSTEQAAAVVRACAEAGIAMVPQGGNTGLCGGAVAHRGSVVISLARMNRIRAVDPHSYTMTAEAGCILADLQTAAAQQDRLFPLSLAAEGSCQIGGNLATNAGGTAVLRYGNARELVLGLEVVLPDGQIWNGLRGLRKDNTGYDLKQLFIGAEGTLGLITAAVLKLFPRPLDSATALVAVRDIYAAAELLVRARGETGDAVSGFELVNRLCLDMVLKHLPGAVDPIAGRHEQYVLIELTTPRADAGLAAALESCLGRAAEAGIVLDAAIAQNDAQAKAFWRLREAVSDVQKYEGGSIKHDITVPISRIAEFIDQATRRVEAELPGIRVCAFGHVGDGNVHFNLTQPVGMETKAFLAMWGRFNQITHDIATEMHGSFSAEHGIGELKLAEMMHYKSPVELELMRRLKQTLDPANLMNPGKVVPTGHEKTHH
jgi:FAD/FMN-containing dehydrogenase